MHGGGARLAGLGFQATVIANQGNEFGADAFERQSGMLGGSAVGTGAVDLSAVTVGAHQGQCAFFGAIIFGMVLIGLTYTQIDQDWYLVFLGGMLLIAVLFNNMIRKRVTGER